MAENRCPPLNQSCVIRGDAAISESDIAGQIAVRRHEACPRFYCPVLRAGGIAAQGCSVLGKQSLLSWMLMPRHHTIPSQVFLQHSVRAISEIPLYDGKKRIVIVSQHVAIVFDDGIALLASQF